MNAWSRTGSPHKARRATALLHDMTHRYHAGDESLKPDVLILTILIKACSRISGSARDKQEAFVMANDAMATLQNTEFGPPNDVAYSEFMAAICNLTETIVEREKLLEAAFRNCADGGYVSVNVIDAMNRGGSPRLFLHLTGTTNQLKAAWSRNVPPGKRPLSLRASRVAVDN